ncbi:MAG: leucine--tRNA ligase [Leptospirales bacterium]|nr:leucine--tRNA ligase [Leptospirales bacterium]
MSYPFAEIERKWQAVWEQQRIFRTGEDRSRPKYYVLDMFPYPSGAGLHVGHPEGYTATDIIARYKRMRGYNVLHPMGWDAFGLPAERYAMQTGIHPAQTTKENIDNFRRQLKALGFSYDWERELSTTDKEYYRWTQWIFLKLFHSWYDPEQNKARPISDLQIPAEHAGDASARRAYTDSHRLAYVAEMPVNWCAELGTVLANEEVEEWTSKGYSVERRPMRQWMLRITAYAERLLSGLEGLDWPAGTLELQRNWIGRSEGAEIDFAVARKGKGMRLKRREDGAALRVYTTRPDTIFGVTYMVLAPEHPMLKELTTAQQRKMVEHYVHETARKSERDRQAQGEKAQKSGVFTGGYVIHPLTGEGIPVWTADYVLMGYGTGAIMAVPAHDERDFAFARKFDLPLRRVVAPASEKVKKSERNPGSEDAVPDFEALQQSAREGAVMKEAFTAQGQGVHSGLLDGHPTAEAIARMAEHLDALNLGLRRVNYRLRDWLFSRQRYWGEPIPISFDDDGAFVAEAEKDLPLELPDSDQFQPAASGESPLANLSDWVQFKRGGKALRRETNTMPQWAGSCWYYLRFIDPRNKKTLVDPDKERYWMGDGGVDLYVGGSEHAVLHLLYARFWQQALYDLGYVSSPEPFRKLIHQGLILGEDGEKMSKSRGNVVNPDEVVQRYGADAFRMFEMFLGPLDQVKPWASRGIEGVFRFLMRVWRMFTYPAGMDDDSAPQALSEARIDPELLEPAPAERLRQTERIVHQTIRKVTEDIERFAFNTAISQLMIFTNEFLSEKRLGGDNARSFIKLLSPFAPHLADELWALLGEKSVLAHQDWPGFDLERAAEDELEIVFQVNGKVRARAKAPVDEAEEQLQGRALNDESVKRAMDGKSPKRIIVVKNKLVNIVV